MRSPFHFSPGGATLSALAFAACFCSASSWAAGPADAARLGKELSPAGAEIAASADGVIPAWTTPGEQGPGWSYGRLRGDHWKHKGDQPHYTINAANVDKYLDKLSEGQMALLKGIKDFSMEVYPSRRSCGNPNFINENTRKNVGFAKLNADGNALQEAYVPGIPFPMPGSGAEAMVNAKMRYRGVGLDMSKDASAVSPRKGSSEWLRLLTDVFIYFPWAEKGSRTFSQMGQLESLYFYNYLEPTSLAGQSGVNTVKAGTPSETFMYFPGQRRVRRMPSFAYDAPQVGLDNQYNVDESNMLSGELDRFDWKLVGKKEMLVPYNSFGAYDFKAKFEDVALRDFIAPSHRRYELHRVWVVEATVRQGMRHAAPKRIFYIDEDSWSIVLAVDYDAQGRVWKVREGYLIPVYETGSCDVEAQTQYNLVDGRYLFDSTSIAAGKDIKWIADPDGSQRMKRDFYTADNLRAISER